MDIVIIFTHLKLFLANLNGKYQSHSASGGGWELILEAMLYAPPELYTRSEHMKQNEIMSGALYFKGKSIPCKGKVTYVHDRGAHNINIYIVS